MAKMVTKFGEFEFEATATTAEQNKFQELKKLDEIKNDGGLFKFFQEYLGMNESNVREMLVQALRKCLEINPSGEKMFWEMMKKRVENFNLQEELKELQDAEAKFVAA